MSAIAKKKEKVLEILSNYQKTEGVIFFNFSSIRNEKIFSLKQNLRKINKKSNNDDHDNCFWKIYKNTLVEKALEKEIASFSLSNSNALIFFKKKEFQPLLTTLVEFNQKNNPNIMRFRGAIYEKKIVSADNLRNWANLPNEQTLLENLCYYLTFDFYQFFKVLGKIRDQKSA